MNDLVARVGRMERELKIWRVAAVAGVVVLACKSSSAPAKSDYAEFAQITVTNGKDTLEILPHRITIKDEDGSESSLGARSVEISGKGPRGNEQRSMLLSSHLSLDGGGPELPTTLAPGHLSVTGSEAIATLRAADDGSQLVLQNDLTSPHTTAVMSANERYADLRLAYRPEADIGHGTLSLESSAEYSHIWMQDDDDRELSVTPSAGVTQCTPKPNAPCR